MTLHQHQQIIELYRQSGFRTQNQVYQLISNVLRINRTTIRGVIARYIQRGKIELRRKCADRQIGIKTRAVLDYVTNEERLQHWGNFTCKERCVIIHRELGVKIHPSFLRKIYIKHNIKYRRVKIEPLCANYATIDARRSIYALKIAQIITDDKPIIYLDETTFHYHLRQSHAWSTSDQRIVLPYSSPRYRGITLFGAIGTGLVRPCFKLGLATNGAEFYDYLLQLIQFIKPNLAIKPILVIDGHRAHFTVENQILMDTHFTVTQLPSSSCEFSSIESLWGLFKQKFKTHIAQKVGQIQNQDQLNEQVMIVVRSFPDALINKFITANREHIRKYLIKLQAGQ